MKKNERSQCVCVCVGREGESKEKRETGGRVGMGGEGKEERERVLISGFPSLMLRVCMCCCSVKPVDRSPSRSCRRTGAPRRLVRYDNIHLDSSILTLVPLISILSSNTFILNPTLLRWIDDEKRNRTNRPPSYYYYYHYSTTLSHFCHPSLAKFTQPHDIFHISSRLPLFQFRKEGQMRVGRLAALFCIPNAKTYFLVVLERIRTIVPSS